MARCYTPRPILNTSDARATETSQGSIMIESRRTDARGGDCWTEVRAVTQSDDPALYSLLLYGTKAPP